MKQLIILLIVSSVAVVIFTQTSKKTNTADGISVRPNERKTPNSSAIHQITSPIYDPRAATGHGTRIDDSSPDEIREYYASGKLKRTTPLRQKQVHGLEVNYYDMEEKKSKESSFFTGKKHGRQMEFYKDGTIKSKVIYQNNILNGWANYYYPNGKLKSKCRYVAGKKSGTEMIYNEQGKLIDQIK